MIFLNFNFIILFFHLRKHIVCFQAVYSKSSSETQGQLVGAGKSLKGREKNLGKEKSRKRGRAPGGKVLTDQFQMVRVVFSAKSLSSKTRSRFVFPYMKDTYRPVARHMLWVYLRRKVPITAQNVGRKKLAGNTLGLFAGIIILAYLKDHEFLYTC